MDCPGLFLLDILFPKMDIVVLYGSPGWKIQRLFRNESKAWPAVLLCLKDSSFPKNGSSGIVSLPELRAVKNPAHQDMDFSSLFLWNMSSPKIDGVVWYGSPCEKLQNYVSHEWWLARRSRVALGILCPKIDTQAWHGSRIGCFKIKYHMNDGLSRGPVLFTAYSSAKGSFNHNSWDSGFGEPKSCGSKHHVEPRNGIHDGMEAMSWNLVCTSLQKKS
jgi:hypothetical protein